MNKERLSELSTLFGIVEHCAKHGRFNRLSSICMDEICKIEDQLEKEKTDGEQPNQ